ncbi:MAG: TraR/DksA family transcriptional regulator [Gemmatimonadales bacterium]
MSAPTMYRAGQPPRPLDAEQLAGLRRELEQELHRLIPDARRAGNARFRSELAQALSPRPRSHALQLIDALRRMDAGVFGLCAGCQGTIAYARLSAIPETTVCAECSWSRELSFRR